MKKTLRYVLTFIFLFFTIAISTAKQNKKDIELNNYKEVGNAIFYVDNDGNLIIKYNGSLHPCDAFKLAYLSNNCEEENYEDRKNTKHPDAPPKLPMDTTQNKMKPREIFYTLN